MTQISNLNQDKNLYCPTQIPSQKQQTNKYQQKNPININALCVQEFDNNLKKQLSKITNMSQWKLPVIDSKKQFGEDDDYNFVNKDKKKPKEQSGALSMIEQLKYKIQEQKKQIENRNATIMGLQRNFQSLSAIVKNEKVQSAALKAELQNLRQNSENGDKRALQFHEKCIQLQNENKMLKQQLSNLKRAHSECNKIAMQSQTYKNKIIDLEAMIEKYSMKLDTLNQDKKGLESELAKLRGQQKNKRIMQQRICDLEDELKKSMDIINGLNDRLKTQEDKIHEAKSGSANNEAKITQLLRKIKDEENRKRSLEAENEGLKKQIRERHREVQDMKKNADSMDLYSKMRQQQQQKFKEELKSTKIKNQQYKQQIQKLSEQISLSQKESNKKSQALKVSQKQLDLLRTQINKYRSEVEKLTRYVGELNKQLDTSMDKNKQLNSKLNMESNEKSFTGAKLKDLQHELEDLNAKMQNRERYSKYFKQIDEHQAKGIVITNKAQMQKITKSASSLSEKLNQSIDSLTEDNNTMKRYIASLEKEVNQKSKEINQKNKALRTHEEKLQNLKYQEKKLAETIAEERKKTQQFKRQSQQMMLKSQKQIEEQRLESQKKIEQQQQKASRLKKMLQEYQAQEQKLKKLMSKEQQQIKQLSKNKQDQINQLIRQKQIEIEKQRKNNKLLWTDNKKLKEMEQKMRDQAIKQIEQIESRKKLQIQRLKKQLQKRYQQELNTQKQQESNSNQLKKILQEKAQQIKVITENHTKIKSELEFYKNRNKQLEGVVSRTQKTFKDQLTVLQKQVKTNKQVIQVLDKKSREINLVKQEIERKAKSDIQKLNEQVQYLKQKYEGQKIEQKLALLQKSIGQFQATLKAIGNSLSCNYCMEPVKQCIRLKDCGHIYCRKCKAGYQPNCGQCKKSSIEMPDKMVDDTISKTEYMKIIVNTVKEDLRKVNL